MRQPAYGVFPWWPENGDDWIHPEDTQIVRDVVPGPRVFRRDQRYPKFLTLSYGPLRFRVRPTLWHPVRSEGFDVGDQVEIQSRMGKNFPGLAVICDMTWHRDRGTIDYHVRQRGMRLPRRLTAADLRHVKFLT